MKGQKLFKVWCYSIFHSIFI